MNRTYLKDAEPLPQQLHKTCTEVRQAVTKELFTVIHQLRGDSKICNKPADQCVCANHKNFSRHFPAGFRCSRHPNCLMQFQGHIDSGFCLECDHVRDPNTTYKQEIWFMPPKPTVKVGHSSAFAKDAVNVTNVDSAHASCTMFTGSIGSIYLCIHKYSTLASL